MPINKRTFYSKKEYASSASSGASTDRWVGRRKFTSSVVVPPSEPPSSSGCLSLPAGMSPPRGSPSTSPESSLVQSFAKPVITTRFTNALLRNNKLLSLCPAPLVSDPAQKVSPSKRCRSWLQHDLETVSNGASNTIKTLVDYSPSSSASSCPSAQENRVAASAAIVPVPTRRMLFNQSCEKSSTQLLNNSTPVRSHLGIQISRVSSCRNQQTLPGKYLVNPVIKKIKCTEAEDNTASSLQKDPAISDCQSIIEKKPPHSKVPDEAGSETLSTTESVSSEKTWRNSIISHFEPEFFLKGPSLLPKVSSDDSDSLVYEEDCHSESKTDNRVISDATRQRTLEPATYPIDGNPEDPPTDQMFGLVQDVSFEYISVDQVEPGKELIEEAAEGGVITNVSFEYISVDQVEPGKELIEEAAEGGVILFKEADQNSTVPTISASGLGTRSKDDVVKDLLKKRDKVLEQRKQEAISADGDLGSDHESENTSDVSFVPSNNAPSSDSENDNVQDSQETPGLHHQAEELDIENGTDDENDQLLEEGETGQKKRQKRRVRQAVSRKRQALQIARNSGQSYVSPLSGKLVSAKVATPLSECRQKCATKLSPDICSTLCSELWKLGDHDKRAAYIGSLIEIFPKASQKLHYDVTPQNRKKRELTMKYHVIKNGTNINVCKGCFLKIFQVTSKFVEIVTKKKFLTLGGMVSDDQRGTACTGGVSPERLKEVHDHLNSFPKYESHYARAKCNNLFLPSNLTMKIMYEEYKKSYPTKPVSRFIYEREFHAMGLKIKPLKIDTCRRCDKLATAINYATSEEKKQQLKVELELHHRKAEKAISQKQIDTEGCKKDQSKLVLAFDLQQCLPTPHLQTSVVFYKRQLWVYNLTIHNCKNGKSVHNMWHEAEAERGPNEVGSALYKYIMDMPDDVEELTLYSDTCAGQNKNSIINAALQTALSHKDTLLEINQKFLVAGHTHLDCDTDHAAIEKKRKRLETSTFLEIGTI